MKASFIASILALGIASVSAQRRGTASVEIFAGLTGESAVTEVVIDQGLQPVNVPAGDLSAARLLITDASGTECSFFCTVLDAETGQQRSIGICPGVRRLTTVGQFVDLSSIEFDEINFVICTA